MIKKCQKDSKNSSRRKGLRINKHRKLKIKMIKQRKRRNKRKKRNTSQKKKMLEIRQERVHQKTRRIREIMH